MPFMKKVKNGQFKYTNSVSALETITVPATGTNNFNITWGDGTPPELVTTPSPTHEYIDAGSFQISIAGSMSSFSFNDGGSKLNVTSLDQWGDMGLTVISGGFHGCANMLSVPGGPITGANLVVSCNSLFRSTKITSVNSDLFNLVINVTTFNSTFLGSSLNVIASGLFDNNLNVITFISTFRDSDVEIIPAGLFDNNTSVTSFDSTFLQLPLIAIPNRLFFNNNLVTNYNRIFRRPLSASVTLPSEIFDLSNLSIVTTFDEAFSDTAAKFTGTIQDIWNFALSSTSVNTFLNQTDISNFASIPNDWKGL